MCDQRNGRLKVVSRRNRTIRLSNVGGVGEEEVVRLPETGGSVTTIRRLAGLRQGLELLARIPEMTEQPRIKHDLSTRIRIIRQRWCQPDQIFFNCLMDTMKTDLMAKRPSCEFLQLCEGKTYFACSARELEERTLTFLRRIGIPEHQLHEHTPQILTAVFNILQKKPNEPKEEKVVVEFLDRAPSCFLPPRSILRTNQFLKRRHE